MSRLVVVSNRVAKPTAGSKGSEGGLAVGVMAAMQESGGLWFGWNGKIESHVGGNRQIDTHDNIDYVTVSLNQQDYNHYYKGFANSVLWPLFHQRPELMAYSERDFNGYLRVNKKFADTLITLLRDDDIIWIHDYHLIPLAELLRKAGVKQPIGFFLHTPFPPLDMLRTIPGYRRILRALLHYDLVGFHTSTDLRGFYESARYSLNATIHKNGVVECENKKLLARKYPIGIETDSLPEFANRGMASKEFLQLKNSLANRQLIIGVDRLDYSKGIYQRILAYERLLQERKDLHRKMVYLQVAPTSRGDVQAYGDLAKQIDRAAGHVIGTFADFDWMPMRYINRGFRRNTILAMYNLAHVAFVTPLRDGMNLVAKEYVAAQSAEDPGVLVLSKMAGAAAELDSALIVNPYDINSVASSLSDALEMPLDERIDRWKKMMTVLRKNNIHAWHANFIGDLLRGVKGVSVDENTDVSEWL